MASTIGHHWNKVGSLYDKYWHSAGKQMLLRKELNFINRYLALSKPTNVLDIGVGTGRILENYLQSLIPKYIDGVDASQTMIDICQKKFFRNKRIRQLAICNISTQKIPFLFKYDLITAIRVFKYTRDWKEIIKKTAAHLNQKGIFIFSIPNARSYILFTRPETQEYYSTIKEIKKVIANHGLELLEITSFSKIPDTVYNLANSPLTVRWLARVEGLLKVIGKNIGGKEFFIAVRKI